MAQLKYLKNVVNLEYDPDKCTGCGMCAVVCPHGVFAIEDKKAAITDRDLCMECGACALNCAPEAIIVDSGVGCAAGVIRGVVGGTEPTCDCTGKPDKNTTCC
jgi:NAD-dependent dihydropyrimidine dehydrogenase PreA subunit